MPMPVTRPLSTGNNPVLFDQGGQLLRPPAPTLGLPPSKGMALPYQQGIVHTVADTSKVVPMPVTRAGVT